jgi:hypothetical protein
MGVDLVGSSPHLNPPPPWGEEVSFGSIGVPLCESLSYMAGVTIFKSKGYKGKSKRFL